MPTTSNRPDIQLHPYHANLSPILAQRIIQDCKQQLPILDNIIILIPNYHASTRLREELTSQAHKLGFNALLGPQIYTLKDYIEKNTLLNKKRIPSESRELILIQALEENRGLFGEQNLLTIAYSLLELFDELTRHQITLPESVDDFIQQLEAAYQCSDTQISALSQEATIIHTLWQAWHSQLSADNMADLETHYQLKLTKNLQQPSNAHFYVAGYYEYLPSEIQWINTRKQQGKASLYFHGQSNNYDLHPSTVLHSLFLTLGISPKTICHNNDTSHFLDAVFHHKSAQFRDRAAAIKNDFPESPVLNKIFTFEGNSFEEEARAIEIQVRAWMASNIKHIALIIEDRMLARRVRALLEQSGIGLKDMEGWALSTSAAASIIESWLQTIEENFHHLPLLDVIKSPFSLSNIKVETETIYRFEQDIIRHENISSDLNRYRKACSFRQHRLNIYNLQNADNVITLLNHVEKASEPLHTILRSTEKLSVFLNALSTSLDRLGCISHLEKDPAGEKIISLLQTLKENVNICDIKMDWLGFRHWLGKKLEENTFKPESNHKYYVELLHLTQSSLGHYEALIIGSMTQDSFPGSAKQTPFFNQSVRMELDLPAPQLEIQTRFYHFRRLLESAPNVLLTMHTGPQENLPSAWLALLKNFHQLTYDSSLENAKLQQWVATRKNSTNKSQVEERNNNPKKAATIKESQLPESISASAHQTLVNCPYAFFAAQILRLRAPDEIRDTLAKSDYGERVHLCLHAFHSGEVKQLPGPFPEPVTTETRERAISFLSTIAKQAFSQDIEDNFQHRGWLRRWQLQIPKYIDWEIVRARSWKFKAGEFSATKKLCSGMTLNGRIDRMDSSREGLSIIDYKTGSIPKANDVETGEAVQLAHYALSSENEVTRIEYLLMEDQTKKQVISKCELEKDDLLELKHLTEERLTKMIQSAGEGHTLEPWGIENSCQYCAFKGLCRKQFN